MLRTVTVILGLLLVLDSHHITSRLIVEYAIGVLLVLGLVEILARPATTQAAPKRSTVTA